MPPSAQSLRRRDEYAQATRRAILDAARQLFSRHGYFTTKVDEIAALARVAPATVYAVSGGKSGLLRSLVDLWSTAPVVAATIAAIEASDDPEAIIRLVSASCRGMREEFGDIVRLILTTAPHDQGVAESLAIGTKRYREAFVPIVSRLLELGALQEGMGQQEAIDIFWFYFGYAGIATLHDDNGWPWERAEKWLCEQACRALLRRWRVPSAGRRRTLGRH